MKENERKYQETRKEFKKHYRYAMRLKEGGKAWDREMTICERLLKVMKELNEEIGA